MPRKLTALLLVVVAPVFGGCPASLTPELRHDRARRFAEAGDCVSAIAEYRRLIGADPMDLTAHRGWVECAARSGGLDALVAEFRARSESAPRDAVARYVLGLARLAAPEEAARLEAAALLDEAAGLEPRTSELHYRAGLAWLLAGRAEEARKRLNEALRLAPGQTRYYPPAADALFRTGLHERALELLGQMVGHGPRRRDVLLGREVVARNLAPDKGLTPAAKADLNAALDKMDPGGDAESALSAIESLLAQHPEVPMLHQARALVLERLSRHPEATESLRRCVELAPGWAKPRLGLAAVYGALGRQGEALEQYQQARKLDPLSEDARVGLGEIHMARGEFEQAASVLQELVLLSGGEPAARLWLARALSGAGRELEAETELRGVLAEAPDNTDALFLLAMVRADASSKLPAGEKKQDALVEAGALVDRLLELNPNHPGAKELRRQLVADENSSSSRR